MIPDKPSPQLRTLDTTSPKFHEQLSDFLRGGECQDTFPRLQSEDLALLVEHLDSVSPQVIFLHSTSDPGVGSSRPPQSYKFLVPGILAKPHKHMR